MKSPREKCMNDPHYNHLVCTLEGFIHDAQFTPSELREACVLASINYEMKHIRQVGVDPRVEAALLTLDKFAERRGKR